jgi:4-hydroxy-tetrahydrodipicolinate synthase
MPTPLDERGEVDEKTLRALVDRLIEGGIDGLFPMGTTGEFALFTREERRRVIDVVVDQAGDRVPVMAGVSDPSPENVRLFCKDAEESGVDALMATPPYYYTVTDEGVYSHFEEIHSHSRSPLFVYNIPEWTHNFVKPSVVQRLADSGLISGMKYTEYNLLNLLKFIVSAGDRIDVLTGSDAMLCTCLEFGGSGGIVSVSNLFTKETSSIYDLIKEEKPLEARRVQVRLLPAIEAAGVGKFPAGLKEAMKQLDFPVGDVRRPQLPVSSEERESIGTLLKTAAESLKA